MITDTTSAGWNGVDTTRVPGRAAQQSPDGQCAALQQAVDLECLDRVGATAGVEAARRRQGGRHPALVAADQRDERDRQRRTPAHDRLDAGGRSVTRGLDGDGVAAGSREAGSEGRGRRRSGALLKRAPRRARSSSAPRLAESACADAGRARTTIREPLGASARRSRMRWRRRRATRWRTTDPPTALLTTNPTRELPNRAESTTGPSPAAEPDDSGSRTCITTSVRPERRPRRTTVVKSSRSVSRAVAGSTARMAGSGRQLLPALAAARGEDGPAGAGVHPQPKAVDARTTAVVRLKRALTLGHCSALPISTYGC